MKQIQELLAAASRVGNVLANEAVWYGKSIKTLLQKITGAALAHSPALRLLPLGERLGSLARAAGKYWPEGAITARRTPYLLIAFLTSLAVVATVAVFAGQSPVGSDKAAALVWVLVFDCILLLGLTLYTVRQVLPLWRRRQQGQAGARLHSRLLLWFATLAALPAVLVLIFAAAFFHFGVEQWFSTQVRTVLGESLQVADAYVEEHRKNLFSDALSIASDLNADAVLLQNNPAIFDRMLKTQAMVRGLSEAVVFDSRMNILARGGFSFSLEFEPLSQPLLQQADRGEPVLLNGGKDDRVRILMRLGRFVDAYLYVGRTVDSKVLAHAEGTREAVRAYRELENRRSRVQAAVLLIFIIMTALLLLLAMWCALWLAQRLVQPIGALADAADLVGQGHLDVTVVPPERDDEIRALTVAFNNMTTQLLRQKDELLSAAGRNETDRARMASVLSGVTTGVLGVTAGGVISFANGRAGVLLGFDEKEAEGRRLGDVIPEMRGIIENQGGAQEVQISRAGISRMLLVRVSRAPSYDGSPSYILAMDDMTTLIQAQKQAAWTDVAKRLAHEIKNPLTPIQLSAERLRRRYLKQIGDDTETFTQCLDTIVRQVGDIGRLVNEFSQFARLPQATREQEDITSLCEDIMAQQMAANPDISYYMEIPAQPLLADVDAGQFRQVVTNLLKNASEAITERLPPTDGKPLPPGEILLRLYAQDALGFIAVYDNGKGLPTQERERLGEPYFTTRGRGSGLGLAIVRRIAEDHRGTVQLQDRPGGGAIVTVSFALVFSGACDKKAVRAG